MRGESFEAKVGTHGPLTNLKQYILKVQHNSSDIRFLGYH